MVPSFLFYVRGYLVITVTGNFPERFLNVCAAQNILLWDITKISAKAIRCKISVRAFKRLTRIAYHTGVSVKINARYGLPFFFARYKKRKLMLSGAVIFILFVILINQFVWDIEIQGNKKVKSSDILAALEAEGVSCGILKHSIDQRTVKNQTMLRLPSLSWLWIDKKGSKLLVEVRERTPTPEIFKPDDYCNITAKKDAVIEEMIIRFGAPTVSVGDTVQKDTVLVTGKIPFSLKPETRFVQADAQIYGKIWYEKTQKFSRIAVLRNRTQNHKKQYTLKLFGKELPLFHNSTAPFQNYDTEQKVLEASVFGYYLGATLLCDTYHEVEVTQMLHTEESTVAQGVQVLKGQIEEEVLPDSTLLSETQNYSIVDETTLAVTVRAEYRENIAQKVKGEREENDT